MIGIPLVTFGYGASGLVVLLTLVSLHSLVLLGITLASANLGDH
jgi:hypothetical protein